MSNDNRSELAGQAKDLGKRVIEEADARGHGHQTRGAGIGGAAGAMGGTFIAGPVGALIGGAVGGWLGARLGKGKDG